MTKIHEWIKKKVEEIKNNMTILFIKDLDLPNGDAGTAHASLIIKGIRENNEKAALIIPRGKYTNEKQISFRRKGHFKNIPFLFMVNSKDNPKNLFNKIFAKRGIIDTALFLWKREKSGKKDIVVIGQPNIIKHFPIILICWLKKISLFFWIVEKMSLNLDFKGLNGILKYLSEKLSEKYLNKFSAGNIVISTYLEKFYRKYLPKYKILLSPIIVDPHIRLDKIIRNNLELLEKKYNGKNIIFYCGSFGEKDGIHYLLEAFAFLIKKYPNAFFIMTGKSSNKKIIMEIKNHILALRLNNHVELTGYVSRELLLYYTLLSDVLLVCRTNSEYANYGFPWKIAEYSMTGKPILATKVGDIEKYFKDGENMFLVKPEDPKLIANKLIEIFENYNSALQIAKKGKSVAIKHFKYLEQTKRIVSFIKKNI